MIPLQTTTVSILVPNPNTDPYELPTYTTSASGVRAHFSSPNGTDLILGGDQTSIDARLDTDPVTIPHTAVILDESTNEKWSVVWSRLRVGLGLDHTENGVNRVEGMVPS